MIYRIAILFILYILSDICYGAPIFWWSYLGGALFESFATSSARMEEPARDSCMRRLGETLPRIEVPARISRFRGVAAIRCAEKTPRI